MIIKTRKEIPSSEITPESVYRERRKFLKTGAKAAFGVAGAGLLSSAASAQTGDALFARAPADINLASKPDWLVEKAAMRTDAPASGPFNTDEELTPFEDVTTYNNFYEFGTGKDDPARNARDFSIDPWTVEVSGEANKTGTYTLEDILKPHTFEERVFRLRCVEAWSMVIPWVGFSLGDLLKRFEPNGDANYVQFDTLVDSDQMSAQRSRFATIDWPYQEGLRMDEAMNPLATIATGLYDDILPAQNGAPLRLVVPWKYGFKSIKSIVAIRFTKNMPNNTWRDLQASEYGFYANVNPQVSHPRWSQASERRLPTSLFNPRRIDTMMFNGYADEVASMYANMDLRRFY
ncbi:protein-methionine-sulfoxide reductase catalytic subunit MsrP [Gammaproteobacteria bacterium]|nr:protein-methionine-sulfoxide reductase catalytic subunit MsrP [Gammaproteobacteria bacterium]